MRGVRCERIGEEGGPVPSRKFWQAWHMAQKCIEKRSACLLSPSRPGVRKVQGLSQARMNGSACNAGWAKESPTHHCPTQVRLAVQCAVCSECQHSSHGMPWFGHVTAWHCLPQPCLSVTSPPCHSRKAYKAAMQPQGGEVDIPFHHRPCPLHLPLPASPFPLPLS